MVPPMGNNEPRWRQPEGVVREHRLEARRAVPEREEPRDVADERPKELRASHENSFSSVQDSK